MSKTLVRRRLDPANPPALTDAQREELARLAAMRDEDIDTCDIPERVFGPDAIRGQFYRPVKQQVTLRLDRDVIQWFKDQQGHAGGYQTAINAALRKMVEAEMRKTR